MRLLLLRRHEGMEFVWMSKDICAVRGIVNITNGHPLQPQGAERPYGVLYHEPD